MKTKIIILFLIAAIIGCSKKSDPGPANSAASACLLSKSTLNTSSTSIAYNSSNQPTSVTIVSDNGTDTYTIVTDGSGRMTKLTLSGTSQSFAFSTLEATYTGSNAFPSVFKGTFADGSYIQNTYTYNSSNQLTQVVDALYNKTDDTTFNTYTVYSYANSTTKDPSESSTFTGLPSAGGDKTVMHEYTFDDKNLPGGTMLISFFSSGLISGNNVLTDKVTYSPGTANEVTTTQTYTYQYNSQNYPTQRSYQLLGKAVTEFYTYSNCK